MTALARWCFRHRAATVAAWLLLLVGLGVVGQALGGTSYTDSFSLPGTESTRATQLLQKAVPAQAGDSDSIVWKTSQGSVGDAEVRSRVTAMLTKVSHLPHVESVASPYAAGGSARISKDGTIAYASVTFDGDAGEVPTSATQKVIDTAQDARTSTLSVELGGQAIKQVSQKPTGYSEVVGLAAAAIVLFLAFGSLFATLMPLLTAVAGLGVGIQLAGVLSHAFTIASLAPTLSALIGLGVGIDYALFIVTRHRNAIKAGRSPEDSAVAALNTSGRAVIFAGLTVCIALLGLLILGVSFLNGVAVAAALTVVMTVAAAVTLLPALLGVLGMRVLSRKERAKLAATGPIDANAGSRWARWSDVIQQRPRLLGGLALIAMLALAVPTLSIRLGSSDSGNDPASSTTRKAYDLLAQGFGAGFNGPLLVVAEHASGADAGTAPIRAALGSATGVAQVVQLPVPSKTVSIFTVYPTTSPQSEQTQNLLDRLRDDVLPPVERSTGTTVYIGGSTATFSDFASVLTGKLPLFVVVIVVLGALLLMLAFRSLLVPLTAAVMNLLAAAAAFGVVVAVFQFGWGSEAMGMGKGGPVEAFVPVFLIAILFGLSMDYQVFLVSRMHEEWVHSRDNRRAVRVGQAETGRVITAAATIMIMVFLAFVLLGQRAIGEFGIGLAAAVALDAFLLRSILVPAAMHLFGDANWYLPPWLDKVLPHLSVDAGEDTGAPAGPAEPQPVAVGAPS